MTMNGKRPDTSIVREAIVEFGAVHRGVAPSNVSAFAPEVDGWVVEDGYITRLCYSKPIPSDRLEHAHLPIGERPLIWPEWCHEYGKDTPEGWLGASSDVLAHDARGRPMILPGNHTRITDAGIQDLPMNDRPHPSNDRRDNPVTQGIVLTQARVRTPSKVFLFVGQFLAGVLGALAVAFGVEALRRNTRISAAGRAALSLGTGALGGVLVARESPRAGAGIALGGVAAAVAPSWEAIELYFAMRNAPALPVPATPMPALAATPPLAPSAQIESDPRDAQIVAVQAFE